MPLSHCTPGGRLVCAVVAACALATCAGGLAQQLDDDGLASAVSRDTAAPNPPLRGGALAPPLTTGASPLSPGAAPLAPRVPPPNLVAPPPALAAPQAIPGAASAAAPLTTTGGARAPVSAVPYMMGDLLRSSGSINFVYEHVSSDTNFGAIGVEAGGFINMRNAKVADNNNAIPADRFAYQYNFFKNGEGIRGTSSETESTGLPPPLPQLRYKTRDVMYDVNLHTFSYEKAFADGRFSLEARVPFSSGVDNRLSLSGAAINGDRHLFDPTMGNLWWLDLTPTPENTWGNTAWQLQDISLILKVLLYQDTSRNVWFSGGVQLVAPSAPNINLEVTDYWTVYYDQTLFLDTSGLRTRTFHVRNQTWAISPYLALSMAPRGRSFFNGFIQLDVPAGADTVDYTQQFSSTINSATLQSTPALQTYHLLFPNGQPAQESFQGSVHDQTLLHVDIAWGYWIYQSPQSRWLKGVAPTVEFHLTQTLSTPEVLVLPGSPLPLFSLPGFPLEPAPTVGNLSSSNTITDFTVGVDTLIGRSSSLGVAGAFPLGTGDNRTFDSEVLVRFNCCF